MKTVFTTRTYETSNLTDDLSARCPVYAQVLFESGELAERLCVTVAEAAQWQEMVCYNGPQVKEMHLVVRTDLLG